MADSQRQIKNAIIYFLALGVNALSPFIALPVYTRFLTPSDFGALALAQVYAVFTGGIATFGMSTAYERNYFASRHDLNESGKLLSTSLLFVTLTYLVVFALSFTFRKDIEKTVIGSPQHGMLFLWALISQYTATANVFLMTELKNSERAVAYSTASASIVIVNICCAILFITKMGTGTVGLLYAQTIAYGSVTLVLCARSALRYRFGFSKAHLIQSLKIGAPLTPRIFFGVINTQFDKFMIGLLASVGGVGIYDIGQKFSRAVFTCMTAIQNVYSPAVYRKLFDHNPSEPDIIGGYLTPFAYLSIGFAVGAMLIAEEVISYLTPPAYHSATNIVIILSIYYGILFFGKINGIQIIYKKRTWITSLLTIVSVGLNIGLNVPFVTMWGAVGAAIATTISGVISGVISFKVAQRCYRIEWEWKKLISIVTILSCSAVLLIFARSVQIEKWMVFCIKSLIGLAYLYIGYRAGVINKANLLLLIQIIRKNKDAAVKPT